MPRPTGIDCGGRPQPSFNKNFDLIAQNLVANHRQGYVNVIVAGQATQIERLHDIFADRGQDVPHTPVPMELSAGFVDKDLRVLVYTDHQLFERYHKFRLKEGFQKSKQALPLKELMALEPGDFVVHVDITRELVRRPRSGGADVEYVEFAGANHNSWDPAFAREDYWDWLFGTR